MRKSKDFLSVDAPNSDVEIELLRCTASIVSAYVSKNTVALADIPSVIGSVRAHLTGENFSAESKSLKTDAGNEPSKKRGRPAAGSKEVPAVSINTSIKPGHIVCLEDGKKFKTLKRHLTSEHGLTPQQYKDRWGLPSDYPMVAPQYASRRSELAKVIGLGKGRSKSKGPKN